MLDRSSTSFLYGGVVPLVFDKLQDPTSADFHLLGSASYVRMLRVACTSHLSWHEIQPETLHLDDLDVRKQNEVHGWGHLSAVLSLRRYNGRHRHHHTQ